MTESGRANGLCITESGRDPGEEAPYLSFYEAMRYLDLDRVSTRELLVFYGLPLCHISRKGIDKAKAASAGVLAAWQSRGAGKSGRYGSLSSLLAHAFARKRAG